ncbi:chaplin [Streptomyces kaniharaensis]|uniref:Chaplin n=1 Tax=Streptomyces kaniharaensis TaxID=212423 RepID=A0A6N7KPW5_9ACTN|nr:chaplin [Streptomyces kaniharaensis]MQS13576.1 chaplin [Streptomyces kaniharaensis]
MSIKKSAAVGVAVVGMVAAATGTAMATAGAEAVNGAASGAVAGNQVQIPVDAPALVCGNTVNVIGMLTPASLC